MGQPEGALHNVPELPTYHQPHGDDLNQVKAEAGRDTVLVTGHQNKITIYNQTIPSRFIWLVIIGLVLGLGIWWGIQVSKPDPILSNHLEIDLEGRVVTMDDTPIEGAEVEIDRLPGKVKTTTSGDFSIQNIPGKLGERIRIYVKCSGYVNRDEYIFLLDPVRIRLEKKSSIPNNKSNNIKVLATQLKKDVCLNYKVIDISINNNSDNNIVISKAEIIPIWIYGRTLAGEAPISKKYRVSLNPWVKLHFAYNESLDYYREDWKKIKRKKIKPPVEIDNDYTIDETVVADPINIDKMVENKFNIPKSAIERFQVSLGISLGSIIFYAKIKFRFETDQGDILESQPLLIKICTA